MAWSRVDVSATKAQDYLDGKPTLIAESLLAESAAVAQWRTSGSFGSGSNSVDSDYPTTRLCDRVCDVDSRPTAAVVTHYVIMDLSPDSSSNVDFDCILVAGHNFGDIASGTCTVNFQIADDSAFSTNLDTLATWTVSPGDYERLSSFILDHTSSNDPGVYSARYARLKIEVSTGTLLPQISEIWLGQRVSLHYNPNQPWDPLARRSNVVDVSRETGGTSRYVLGREQVAWSAQFDLAASDVDLTSIATLNTQTEGLTLPFVWNVVSGTDIPLVVLAEPSYSRPYQSASHQTFSISIAEQTPFYFAEIA